MKNLVKVALVAAGIFVFAQANAQESKVGKDAKAVGHKTAELSAKGAAAVTDKKYAGKVGPSGQDIYINKNAHYFYVNKTGHRVYLKKSQLRDKPMK